ncbi:hypothetical protein WN55_07231 [Dufourea novaeangliae]|uniref:Uncharacterized protein n=1 Tax=Dufourea novaeangliae TaxID=178035 RepID=A0A154PTC8_DUFNO|nr:hypothetical protein WN55_07231 [Dufourea novaeangliae]
MNAQYVFIILIVHECFYRPIAREQKKKTGLCAKECSPYVVAFINLVAINRQQ